MAQIGVISRTCLTSLKLRRGGAQCTVYASTDFFGPKGAGKKAHLQFSLKSVLSQKSVSTPFAGPPKKEAASVAPRMSAEGPTTSTGLCASVLVACILLVHVLSRMLRAQTGHTRRGAGCVHGGLPLFGQSAVWRALQGIGGGVSAA